jgi:hypothetical protein
MTDYDKPVEPGEDDGNFADFEGDFEDREKGEPIDPEDYPEPEPANPGMPVPGDGNYVPVPDPNEPEVPNPGPDPFPTVPGDGQSDETNK